MVSSPVGAPHPACNPAHTMGIGTDNPPAVCANSADSLAIDAPFHAAWAQYLTAREAIRAQPDLGDNVAQTALEAPFWAICDQAEADIKAAQAKTPAGVAIKIKAALAHLLTDREHDDALRRGDLDALDRMGVDWAEQFLVSALRSLNAMEGMSYGNATAT
ncbi:MAG: hypothetical protein P4M15_03055 [Alphaproteobacteria bacterium]|nr:hypothetical protein [Alphaproteobacteria bacterium]